MSRYYDPAVGRFISADALVASTSGSVQGFNVFSYCFNNPVFLQDETGNWPSLSKIWNGIKKKAAEVKAWVNKNIVQPAKKEANKIYSDIKNFDFNNQSEETVLESNYFSAYKGKLVMRTIIDRSGSLGVIALSKNIKDATLSPEDVVRHEYGHTKQFEELGPINYLITVGIPSLFDLGEKWGGGEYYNKPWEVMANVYGETHHQNSQNDINAARKYQRGSQKVGPLILIFIE